MNDAPEPAPRRWAWRRCVVVACWIALASASAPAVARIVRWETGPVAYLVALVPFVAVAGIVLVVAALAVRARWLAVAATALAVAGMVWVAPPYVADGASGSTSLTVATSNLLVGTGDADAVVAMVRDHQVDVLAVQELTPEAREALAAAGLDDLLPYSAAYPEPIWYGSGLWSRYRLADAQEIDGYLFRQVRGTLELPGGPVTVLALHPAAPQLRDNSLWADETRTIGDVLDAVDGPVLAAGDLNTTRDHAVFRDLESRGFADAAEQAGAGLVPTYPEGRRVPPLVAIDHVVERDLGMRATSVVTVEIPGSDHRALVATYAQD